VTKEKIWAINRLLAIWLFWPAVAVVVWGELRPGGDMPHVWDKLLHFTAYFGLSGLAFVALAGRTRRALLAAVALVVLGGVLEFLQGQIGRDMSFWDEVANAIGVLSGLGVGWAYLALLGGARLVGTKGAD